jgi:uncharacterized protein YneF (UPF0154 family)
MARITVRAVRERQTEMGRKCAQGKIADLMMARNDKRAQF